MSTPTAPKIGPQSERKITEGYLQVPKSLIEHSGLLTDAELRLALAVLRWDSGPSTISDQHWRAWTGRGESIKRKAVAGLEKKGLVVYGQGKSARYWFDIERWEKWAAEQSPEVKARTDGRGTSQPRPAMHPDCIKNGCQRSCEQNPCEEKPASDNIIPITNGEESQCAEGSGGSNSSDPPEPKSTANTRRKVRQPVVNFPPKQLITLDRPPKGIFTDSSPKSDPNFQQLIAVFVARSVPISASDVNRCASIWKTLKPDEQTTALAYALARNEDTWSKGPSRYVPRPWNFLTRKEWTRKAMDPDADFLQGKDWMDV